MGLDASIPGLASAKSYLAMMTDRSPGDRTKAQLTKIKEKSAPEPKERALGKIITPETPKEFAEAIAPPVPKLAEPSQFAPAIAGLPPVLAPPPSGGGGIVVPPQAPPPGGGGAPPPTQEPPTPPPTQEPPPPPPAVPEPATWASMLLGFGLAGLMMRRRRRTLSAVVSE